MLHQFYFFKDVDGLDHYVNPEKIRDIRTSSVDPEHTIVCYDGHSFVIRMHLDEVLENIALSQGTGDFIVKIDKPIFDEEQNSAKKLVPGHLSKEMKKEIIIKRVVIINCYGEVLRKFRPLKNAEGVDLCDYIDDFAREIFDSKRSYVIDEVSDPVGSPYSYEAKVTDTHHCMFFNLVLAAPNLKTEE